MNHVNSVLIIAQSLAQHICFYSKVAFRNMWHISTTRKADSRQMGDGIYNFYHFILQHNANRTLQNCKILLLEPVLIGSAMLTTIKTNFKYLFYIEQLLLDLKEGSPYAFFFFFLERNPYVLCVRESSRVFHYLVHCVRHTIFNGFYVSAPLYKDAFVSALICQLTSTDVITGFPSCAFVKKLCVAATFVANTIAFLCFITSVLTTLRLSLPWGKGHVLFMFEPPNLA